MIVRRIQDYREMLVAAMADEWRETPAGPRLGRVYWVRPPRARDDFPLEALRDHDCVEVSDVD